MGKRGGEDRGKDKCRGVKERRMVKKSRRDVILVSGNGKKWR